MQSKNSLFASLLLVTTLFFSCTGENFDETTETESPVDIEKIVISGEQNALFKRNFESSLLGIESNCYRITFPLTIVDSRNEIFEVQDDTKLIELLEFFKTLPDSVFIVDFLYPVTVESLTDQSVLEVEDQETLYELTVGCAPQSGWTYDDFPAYLINLDNSCYELVYPLQLSDPTTGEITNVMNEKEFIDETIEKFVFFTFPLTLSGEKNDITIYSAEELWEALYQCEGINRPFENFSIATSCIQVIYPIRVNVNNVVVNVQSYDQYRNLSLTYSTLDLLYPMTFIVNEEEYLLESSSDFLLAILLCSIPDLDPLSLSSVFFLFADEFEEGHPLPAQCLDIIYPISIFQVEDDGTKTLIEITSEDLLFNHSDSFGQELAYPLRVKLLENNKEAEVNNNEELKELILTCVTYLRGL